jgi:hypothetical protein
MLLVQALAACTPSLDWREVRPEGSALTLLMPCRPSAQTRSVVLAGRSVRLVLTACSAGGQTWAVAAADLADPAVVEPALVELRQSAARNLGAADAAALPLAVSGATPNAASVRVGFAGHLPDGAAVQEQVALFTRGTVVFQATVVGARLPPDAVDTFFGSLRLAS